MFPRPCRERYTILNFWKMERKYLKESVRWETPDMKESGISMKIRKHRRRSPKKRTYSRRKGEKPSNIKSSGDCGEHTRRYQSLSNNVGQIQKQENYIISRFRYRSCIADTQIMHGLFWIFCNGIHIFSLAKII
jgi:hypothetical protein